MGLEPKWRISMAVFEHLVAIAGRMEAEMVVDQGKLKGCREAAKSCLEKLEVFLERKE
jgi:hypothetical protein